MSEHVHDKCNAYTNLLNANASQEIAANYDQDFRGMFLRGGHLS